MLNLNLSFKNFVTVYCTWWWFLWTMLHGFVIYITLDFPWYLALTDSLVTNTLLAIAGYSMMNVMRFYQPRQVLRLAFTIGISLLVIWGTKWIVTLIWPNEISYLAFVQKSIYVRGLFSWLMISLMTMTIWLFFYMREQQEIEDRKVTAEKLAREAELSKLRQQLQPHFLFNSLNSISALAGSKPEEARKMIQQLSDFLRGTLKKDDQQLVTLQEEFEHLQLYLEIEKVRFGHRLKTHIQQDDKTILMKLPSLLLQPIVENAIKFGLYDTLGDIIIRIVTTSEENYLIVRVENPFDVSTSKPKEGTGFGLNSVKRRLHLLYARQDLLTTTQEENLFITKIKIPQTI
jgi:two-component system LytT family sensor kinase